MEFASKRRTLERSSVGGARSSLQKQLNNQDVCGHHCFYKKPPTGSITLQQFEAYALERLKVLKAIELNNVMKGKNTDEYSNKMKDQFNELGWNFLSSRTALREEDEMKDLVSHHILRLAYAKSEGKRQWFVTQETELMKLRMHWNQRLLNKLLECNSLHSNQVPQEEVQEIMSELQGCQSGGINIPVYYKVDFEEVIQLVAFRKVYLSQGYAYLPASELQTFVLNKYKIHLKEQLAVACKHLPGLEEENRVMKQLQALSGGDLGSGYTSKATGDKITADMLDELSLHSYPMCMSMVHNHVKAKHHAKHEGRMQYGLFLKGMGVSLEESLKYWRTQFCKGGMDTDKFDKNYAYNVRHSYGKEGKRTDYTPFSCMKIITRAEPKGDECHGCPYKHSDEFSLRQMLEKRKISADAMEEILGLKKQGHYQIACMSLFKATHPREGLQGGLQHPNQYFSESQAILNGTDQESSDTKVKQEPKNSSQTSIKSEPGADNKENVNAAFAEDFDDEME